MSENDTEGGVTRDGVTREGDAAPKAASTVRRHGLHALAGVAPRIAAAE